MATKKGSKKSAKKSAAKSSSKKGGARQDVLERLGIIQPLYGRPILDAVRRGDPAELRRIRTIATKHIAEVTAALGKLDAKLNRG